MKNYKPSNGKLNIMLGVTTMKPIKFDEANKNLLKPQNMTDEEWNAENIERTLDFWKKCYKITDELYQQTKDLIMALPLAEIEIRINRERIQYKKVQNVRWIDIEI